MGIKHITGHLSCKHPCFVCGADADVGYLLCFRCEEILIEEILNGTSRLSPLFHQKPGERRSCQSDVNVPLTADNALEALKSNQMNLF